MVLSLMLFNWVVDYCVFCGWLKLYIFCADSRKVKWCQSNRTASEGIIRIPGTWLWKWPIASCKCL